MKNIYLFLLLVCFAHTSLKAQQYSYGVLLGVNFKDINVESEMLSAGAAYSAFNYSGFPMDIGGYFDYGFDESFGIKTNLFYGRGIHEYAIGNIEQPIHMAVDQITIQPMLKYDLNKDYGKGFYLLAGPRASFVLGSHYVDEENEEETGDFLKGSNFGLLFGFGTSFAKIFGLELIGDYGISNLLNDPPLKTKTMGAYLNVYVNLEGLLNK